MRKDIFTLSSTLIHLGTPYKKNAALIWAFFIRGGRGVPGQSKSFGALICAPTIVEYLVEMGGRAKSKSFWALFSPNCWWNMTLKVPQKFQKKNRQWKSVPKFPQFLGGRFRSGLENTQIKAALFSLKVSLSLQTFEKINFTLIKTALLNKGIFITNKCAHL